jgi:hypothetical protein
VQMQASHRFFNRLGVGGSYTWSELRGNSEGENAGSGPITEGGWLFQYPEYQGFRANNPTGYLSGDQRHKLRAWAGMDIPVGRLGIFNVSVLQRFDSGTPYSAVGLLPRPTPTANVAYNAPPQTVQYYFSDRGEFRWDDISRTDFALNYRLPISRLELFFEGEVYNLFNQQGQINGATTTYTPNNTTRACGNGTVKCAAFNPFTDTPVEGVNFARLTPELKEQMIANGINVTATPFGGATSSLHYQIARTYQFSFGLRF